MTKLVTSAALAAMLAATAGQALAQAQAAQAPALNHGSPVPGLCIFNQQGAVAGSSAGQSVANRLKQLGDVVTAELRPEGTTLAAEENALKAEQNRETPAFQQRANTFLQRANAYQQKVAQRQQELQATEVEQLTRISTELRPILTTVYQQRQCSLLVDANSVLAANPAMDITPTVVQQLNAKLPSLTFDRKRLDQQAAARPAAQPAVANRPATPPKK